MDADCIFRARAAFSGFLEFLEQDSARRSPLSHRSELSMSRSRSRSPLRDNVQVRTRSVSPLRDNMEVISQQVIDQHEPHTANAPTQISTETMRLGIVSLIRLYKGQHLSDEEALCEARKVVGEAASHTADAPQQGGSLPSPDPGLKHAMAFNHSQTEQARKAILELRSALKSLDTSTGGRTIQISFRKAFEPVEVAERVELWRGPTGPKIPVEPLVIKRGGKWSKPVGPQSFASAGGDSRKFVLRLQLANASKVEKLSLQVKVATRELMILGSKTVLGEEAPSIIMQFGPHSDVQIVAGSPPKFDVSQFFGVNQPN